ncbi:MAG: type I methionyl aminopeptidase [Thermodesulfobacteriota bacterium]|nr:type I methionyl aminopeptidase [Thermodesulfobacteriota bacterium]
MIILKTKREIELMRKSNQLVIKILKELASNIRPGVTTGELDLMAEKLIDRNDAMPAFKGYRGFPACVCTSLNEQVVHGIPGPVKIREGDIISIDLGVVLNGYFGDAAITVPVGKISNDAKRLLQVTYDALFKGIDQARVGNRLFDISHAIQMWVEKQKFSVVRDFVGHGIGKSLHEDPQVPNFGKPNQGVRLKEGMVLSLEPMVNVGTYQTKVKEDGWTAVTKDGKLSAHFEHTIAITKNGPDILSLLPE